MSRLFVAILLVLVSSALMGVDLFWNPDPNGGATANQAGTQFQFNGAENWTLDAAGTIRANSLNADDILRFDGTGPLSDADAVLIQAVACGGLRSRRDDGESNAYLGSITDRGQTLVVNNGDILLESGRLDLTGTLIMQVVGNQRVQGLVVPPDQQLNELFMLQGDVVLLGTVTARGVVQKTNGTLNWAGQTFELAGADNIYDFARCRFLGTTNATMRLSGAGSRVFVEDGEPVPNLDVVANATFDTDGDAATIAAPRLVTVRAGRTLTVGPSTNLRPGNFIGEAGSRVIGEVSDGNGNTAVGTEGVFTWAQLTRNFPPTTTTAFDIDVVLTGVDGQGGGSPIITQSNYSVPAGTVFQRNLTIRSAALNNLTIGLNGLVSVGRNVVLSQFEPFSSTSLEIDWNAADAQLSIAGSLFGIQDESGFGFVRATLAAGGGRVRIDTGGSFELVSGGGSSVRIDGNASLTVGGTLVRMDGVESTGFASGQGINSDIELVLTNPGIDVDEVNVGLNGDRWRVVQRGGADIRLAGSAQFGSLVIDTTSPFTLIGVDFAAGEGPATREIRLTDRDAIVRSITSRGEHVIDGDLVLADVNAQVANADGPGDVGGGRLRFIRSVATAFGGGDGDNLTISGSGRTVFDGDLRSSELLLIGPGFIEINGTATVVALRLGGNATLAGDGVVTGGGSTGSGAVLANQEARISPGDDERIATLTASDVDLAIGEGGVQVIRIQVAGFAAGTTFDRLAVNNTITFDNRAVIEVDISRLVSQQGSTGGTAAGIITFGSQFGFNPANLLVIGNDGRFAVTLVNSPGEISSIDAVIELVNNLPTIALNDPQIVAGTLAIVENTEATIAFTVNDLEDDAGELDLRVNATSNNPTLLPEGVGSGVGALRVGGTGSNRTLEILPQGSGSAVVTLTVIDSGGLTATTSFNLVVVAAGNDLIAKFIRATDAFAEGTTALVVVELDVAPTQALTVGLSVSLPGSVSGATESDVVLPTAQSVTFAVGQTQAVFSFAVVDDGISENDESFSISIQGVSGVVQPDAQNGTFAGIIADQQTALSGTIDGQLLPSTLSKALNQATSLVVFGGTPPYNVTVDNGATLQSGDLDAGDANNDANVEPVQGFLITPRNLGTTSITISGIAGNQLTATIVVSAARADATVTVPPIAPSSGNQTLYTAVCPGTEAGLAVLKAALAGKDATQVKAFAWDAVVQNYVQLPAEPTGGLTPAHGIFLATRQDLGLNFSGAQAPAPFAILLRPGFNFVGLPPLDDGGSPVTAHAFFREFALKDLLGNTIAQPEKLIGTDTFLWNGVAYEKVGATGATDVLISGNGYWILNQSLEGESFLLERRALSLADTSVKIDTRARATRKLGDPPPPPTEAASRAASGGSGGGCGHGSGFAALALGLLALALRRWR